MPPFSSVIRAQTHEAEVIGNGYAINFSGFSKYYEALLGQWWTGIVNDAKH